MAEKLDKTSLDFDTQCEDKDLTYAVLRELQTHGKKHKLEKFEIPGGVTMVKEIWDPESGLVTAAFKLKRRPLQVSKVHIFWEGHKILQNLHFTFVLCSASQK